VKEANPTYIVVHRGDSWYLPYMLLQASRFIPRERLVLITDIKHSKYDKFCRIVDITAHWERAQKLADTFQNFSPLDPGFELFCMQRWMAIESFMHSESIQRIVHLDSDVMVFTNLDPIANTYADHDFLKTGWQGPHCLFVNTRAAMTALCDFIQQHYLDPALIAEMEKGYALWRSQGIVGGISDMHFLHTFCSSHADKFKIGNNAAGACGYILHDNCFMTDEAAARISFQGRQPYETDTKGTTQPLAIIHCQGMYKRMMPGLSLKKDFHYYQILLRQKIAGYLNKGK
jgi:hypothetical protein